MLNKYVQLRFDGQITWSSYLRMSSVCPINTFKFPFDQVNILEVHNSEKFKRKVVFIY